jgi:ABC-type transport system involved in multi-copper enzyme maturation permease subunit
MKLSFLNFPLVSREMLSQARGKTGYSLRAIVVLILVAPIVFCGLENGFRYTQGRELFGILSSFAFYCLFLLAPILSAGCITSERENETLGLLFLSPIPIQSFEILVSKFASNFLRLLALTIAGLPVIASTLVMGGVTWQQMLGVSITILSLLLMVVGSAVFFSSIAKTSHAAISMCCGYVVLMNWILWFGYEMLTHLHQWQIPKDILVLSPAYVMAEQFSFNAAQYIDVAVMTLVSSLVQVVLFLTIATWWLPKSLHIASGSSSRLKDYFRIKGRRFRIFDKKLRSKNILSWFEYRDVGVRHIALILIIACALGFLLYIMSDNQMGDMNDRSGIIYAMGIPVRWILDVILLSDICRQVISERKERQLELLLCTPFTENELMWARLKGIWLKYGWTYMLVGFPAIWFLPFASKEVGTMVLLDYVEDFFFFWFLALVSYRCALKARNVTNAVLQAFLRAILGYLGLGFILLMIVVNRLVQSDEEFLLLSAGRAIAELCFVYYILRTLPGYLREQSTVPVQA